MGKVLCTRLCMRMKGGEMGSIIAERRYKAVMNLSGVEDMHVCVAYGVAEQNVRY